MRIQEIHLKPNTRAHPYTEQNQKLIVLDDTDYLRSWMRDSVEVPNYEYAIVPANFYKKKISVTIEFEGCFPIDGVADFYSGESLSTIIFDQYKITKLEVSGI